MEEVKKNPVLFQKEKLKRIKSILSEYDNVTNKIISEIIEELKTDCQTYKQVDEAFKLIRKEVEYYHSNQQKYGYLFDATKRLLETEKNDLPLTNRSSV